MMSGLVAGADGAGISVSRNTLPASVGAPANIFFESSVKNSAKKIRFLLCIFDINDPNIKQRKK